eukprot:scpid53740/ scgid24450/ Ubiquinone biosynthesis protein COQ9, mitochondrial
MACQPISMFAAKRASFLSRRCLVACSQQSSYQHRQLHTAKALPSPCLLTGTIPQVASVQNALIFSRSQSSPPTESRHTTSQADTTATQTLDDEPQQQQEEDSTRSNGSQQQAQADTGGNTNWKEELLDRALRLVPQYGWSMASVEKAAEELNLSSSSVGMLENGVGDLVLHFERQCNQDLMTLITQWKAQEEDADRKVGMTRLIREAVRQRLSMIIPHLESWPEALAHFSQPSVTPYAFEMLLHLVDDIWYVAGDRSTDFSWYTKRAMLATVYCSTELFMLQDTSADYSDTWQFLDRRLSDVGQIGSIQATVRQAVCTAVELGSVSLYTAQKLSRTLPPLNSDLWTRPFSGTR